MRKLEKNLREYPLIRRQIRRYDQDEVPVRLAQRRPFRPVHLRHVCTDSDEEAARVHSAREMLLFGGDDLDLNAIDMQKRMELSGLALSPQDADTSRQESV